MFRYQAKGHLRGPATIAEKACTVSHALALALAARKLGQNNVENPAEPYRSKGALIIEDDVTVGIEQIASWPVSIPVITDSLPRDWEYLQLYTPNPKVVRGPHGLLSPHPKLTGGMETTTTGTRPFAVRRSSESTI